MGTTTEKINTMNYKPLKIGIIGSGTMGFQLTKLFLKNNYQVVLVTRNVDLANQRFTKYFLENSNYSSKNLYLTNLTLSVKDCDFIFECIVENLQVKRELFTKLLRNTDGVVASCTSTFTLKEISKDMQFTEKLNVIHFSNPVSTMKIVEIVYSPLISLKNRNLIQDMLEKIEYKAIEVPDISGFIINSLLFPLVYNAIKIHYEHGVTKSNIDILMRSGCGFPMGPFEIIDLVGVKTVVNVLRNLGYKLPDQVLSKFLNNDLNTINS